MRELEVLAIGLLIIFCVLAANRLSRGTGWKSWIYPAPFMMTFWFLLDLCAEILK